MMNFVCRIDDVAVVEKYLQVIKTSGLTLNFKKANFAQPDEKFCGFIVGSSIPRIDLETSDAIKHG